MCGGLPWKVLLFAESRVSQEAHWEGRMPSSRALSEAGRGGRELSKEKSTLGGLQGEKECGSG